MAHTARVPEGSVPVLIRTLGPLAAGLLLAIGGARPLVAQVPTTGAPPAPPVVVPTQRTAAQNAAASMGKQVTNEDIARAIKNSGLSAPEVRIRLQQAGFDPKLADPFFSTNSPLTIVGDSSTLAALNAVGLSVGGDEAAPVTPVGDLAASELDTIKATKPTSAAQRRFGRDVFITRSTSFDPEMSGPVDASYRLGIGDALQIVMTGQVEQGYQVDVRRDGTILLQNIGAVPVAGLTLEAARSLVRERASRSYSGLADGKTTLDLTVTKLRTNQVRLIGEVERPGAYQVSGLSTVFHALARAGGPSARGSFRNIELRRGGLVIKHVDLYDYLIKGDASSDVRTEHGDMIFVPPAMRSVTVVGAMRREGIFELKDNEGFRDLLFFAGGLLPSAATNRIHIDRTLPPEQRSPGMYRIVMDVQLDARQSVLDTLKLQDDDVITVYEIGDLRRNSVVITGPVNQPGAYEWKPGLTVAQLITRAQGAQPWALTDRIKVKRQIASTGRNQNYSLNLSDSADARFMLAEFDEITVLDGRNNAQSDRVTIRGAVRTPGSRVWAKDLTLKDLVDMANGFQPWALSDRIILTRTQITTGKVEIQRINGRDSTALMVHIEPLDLITVPDARLTNPTSSVVVSGAVIQPGTLSFGAGMTLGDAIDLAGGLRREAQYIDLARMHRGAEYSDTNAVIAKFRVDERGMADTTWRVTQLEREDRISVRASPGFRSLGAVTVVGAFRYPGSYVIQREGERMSEIIQRAGGALPIAYRASLRVSRNGRPVPLSYDRILKGEHNDDIAIVDGDQLQLDVESQVVNVAGAVQRQVSIPFRNSWSLNAYIDAAGGFSDSANTSNIIVTYASGEVRRVKTRFRVVTSTPELEPGATITVATKAEEKGDWGKALTITSQAIFTLASLLLSYSAIKK